MNSNNVIKVIIASSSAIVRSGLASVLKRIPDVRINAIEVNSAESLRSYVRTQTPDLSVVDPFMGGWFDLSTFKQEAGKDTATKYVALLCSVADPAQLRSYDETISIYDTYDAISQKLDRLLSCDDEETDRDEKEMLSQREKEIITFVVKGLTNKEIADKLSLSIHTIITHRRNIARKLQIHTPSGLTIYAIVNKLVELKDIEGKI